MTISFDMSLVIAEGGGLDWASRPIEFGPRWWIGLGAIAIVVALWGAVAWYRARHVPRPRTMPWALFAELCQAHRLPAKEARLLATLAHTKELEQPGAVFVQPEVFGEEALDARLASQKSRLNRLKDRLFGG